MHRDLKPQNILVDRTGKNLVLCDFGMAKTIKSGKVYMDSCVSLWYRAPELLLGAVEYDSAIDIWSAGMITAEIINLAPVLEKARNETDCLQLLFHYLNEPGEDTWPGVSELSDFMHTKNATLPRTQSSSTLWADTLDTSCAAARDLFEKLAHPSPSRRWTAAKAVEQHPFLRPHCSPEPDWRGAGALGREPFLSSSPALSEVSVCSTPPLDLECASCIVTPSGVEKRKREEQRVDEGWEHLLCTEEMGLGEWLLSPKRPRTS